MIRYSSGYLVAMPRSKRTDGTSQEVSLPTETQKVIHQASDVGVQENYRWPCAENAALNLSRKGESKHLAEIIYLLIGS